MVMPIKGYHTLQGDNSLKSVERFDHMMFVLQVSSISVIKTTERKAAMWLVNL
jgi:hypothetical protein